MLRTRSRSVFPSRHSQPQHTETKRLAKSVTPFRLHSTGSPIPPCNTLTPLILSSATSSEPSWQSRHPHPTVGLTEPDKSELGRHQRGLALTPEQRRPAPR